MDKAPDAFRTISEVAEVLETPAHVLRFWESRFPQIRPVKRAGGRRYYRPGDVALLAGIRHLLHDQGMTIRGVQKVLRESGVRHVQALATGSGLEAAGAEDMEEALNLDFLDEAETLPGAGAPPIPSADIVPLPRRAEPGPVERTRAEAPPPANTEEVPEAPFIEAPEEPADPAEVHVLHAAPAAAPPEEAPDEDDAPSDELADELGDEDTTSGLFDDLPLLAALSRVSMAQPPAEAEAAPPAEAATDHTAALIAALRDEPAESPRDVTAAEPPTAETPAVAGPDQALAELIGLTLRLRALPRTIEAEAERATALAPVLAQALALQDRLAEARRLDA